MSTAKILLRDGLKPGKVTKRATDRSVLVQITGPKSIKVEWLSDEPEPASPDGTLGARIVEPDGTVWSLSNES